MENLKPNQIFTDGTGNDIRTYRCIDSYNVETIVFSKYQISGDNHIRLNLERNPKHTSFSKIEPLWYKVRGFKVIEENN